MVRLFIFRQLQYSQLALVELNQWLEKFVLQGTAQIQTLSTGVDSLCKELVLPKTQQNQPNSPGASVISMLAEIKGLVAGKSEMEARQTRGEIFDLPPKEAFGLIASFFRKRWILWFKCWNDKGRSRRDYFVRLQQVGRF
jgi:hypothetical protein